MRQCSSSSSSMQTKQGLVSMKLLHLCADAKRFLEEPLSEQELDAAAEKAHTAGFDAAMTHTVYMAMRELNCRLIESWSPAWPRGEAGQPRTGAGSGTGQC